MVLIKVETTGGRWEKIITASTFENQRKNHGNVK